MLQIKDLDVCYGPISAVRNLSIEVKQGEIVALIGANGAGKTTTLRSISRLESPQKGKVFFEGQDISKMGAPKIARLGIAHVPERRGIFANLTVYENLLVGAYSRKPTKADFEEVYELFPRIKERLKQVAGTLSGGEQQMLAISRALLAKPKLMMLDEPSLGLAPQITADIMKTISRINKQGTTVLLIEQNAYAALKIAHRAYVMEVGEIYLTDTAENLLSNDEIRKAYLGE